MQDTGGWGPLLTTASHRITALLLAVATLVNTASAVAGTTGIVVANSGGKTTPLFHQWQEFRRNIDEKSNGTILLDYLIFGELGGGDKMLQALMTGRANLGGLSCSSAVGTIPELAVPQLPYLFQSDAEADYVFDKTLSPIFNQIFAQHGLTLLRWVDFGWTDLFAKEPISLPYELAGRQIRVGESIVQPVYLRKLKAEPVELGLSDLSAPLQTEKIFAGLGSLVFYAPKIPAAYKYITRIHQSFTCGMIVANKAWFDSMDPADQAIIRGSFMPLDAARRETHAAAEQVYQTLTEAGDTVSTLTPEQRNAWAAAGVPLYADILRQAGGRSIEVYDAITAGKRAFLHSDGSHMP